MSSSRFVELIKVDAEVIELLDHYFLGDVMGKDTEVKVEPCDHVVKLVEAYSGIVRSGKVDPQWPERTLACHRVMAALFASAEGDVGWWGCRERRMV